MNTLVNNFLNGYFTYVWRNIKPVWYWHNLEAIKFFRQDKGELNELQKKLIRDLRHTGIATCHLDELMDGAWGGVLIEHLKNYLSMASAPKANPRKPYFSEFEANFHNNPNLVLDFTNPFIKITIHRRVLDIINNYLGMYCRFFEYTLAKIDPTDREPQQSQTWHRDAYDKKFVKMFIYLTDVDLDSGPFIYLQRSHPKGKLNKIYPQYGITTTYLPPKISLPEKDIKVMTGKAGTVIFCDTTGIHYGGYCKTKSRIMFTASYRTSGAPIKPKLKLYGLPKNLELTNPAVRYALFID